MNKLLSFFLLSLGVGFSAMATPLTPQQALSRTANYGARKLSAAQTSSFSLAATERSATGAATIYVYNRSNNNGYLILAADDVAPAMLGYSDRGNYSSAAESPEFRYWLDEYSRQIEYAVANGLQPQADTRADANTRKAVAPLVSTKWNQGAPFNNECPEVNGNRCVTGCVATAMAQIMNYWKYPAAGHGTVKGYRKELKDSVAMTLGLINFDWENMSNSYSSSSTTAQKNAVAYLMKACGYSTKMGYGSESGTPSRNCGYALINNFDYNKNLSFIKRNACPDWQWDEYVYQELAAGRPVYYAGYSTAAGHAFVCDGYDGSGLYHFNWGWGGTSDGYFRLQALDPHTLGIGGGTGGYNINQEIIVGIQPETVAYLKQPTLISQGSLQGRVTGNTLDVWVEDKGARGTLWNDNLTETKYNLCLLIKSTDDSSAAPTILDFGNVTMPCGTGIYGATQVGSKLSFASIQFPTSYGNGKYIATIGVRNSDGSNFRPLDPMIGYSNYVTVEKSASGLTITNEPFKSITIVSGGFTSPLYYKNDVKVSVTVYNPHDEELTQVVAPTLWSSDNMIFRGEGPMVVLRPKETKTLEFLTSMNLQSDKAAPTGNTTYDLIFKDNQGGTLYPFKTSVTMKVVNSAPNLSITASSVSGVTPQSEYLKVFQSYMPTYATANNVDIPFTITVKNYGGFFSGSIYGFIFDGELGGNNLTYFTYPNILIDNGEMQTITAKYTFDQAVVGKPYLIQHYYMNGADSKNIFGDIAFRVKALSSGVEEVEVGALMFAYDSGADALRIVSENPIDAVSIVNMAGVQVFTATSLPSGSSEVSLASLPGGIYLATLRSGTTVRTLKIRK